jgi:hypothetical protein
LLAQKEAGWFLTVQEHGFVLRTKEEAWFLVNQEFDKDFILKTQ